MAFAGSVGALLSRPGMQVVAGLLSGVVGGGALIASGAIPVGGSRNAAPTVDLTACPGAGPVLARIPDGQPLLVTARTADGGWLQIYVGLPGLDRGWAPATTLRVDSSTESLPLADCSAPTPAPLGSPTATATVSGAPPSALAPSIPTRPSATPRPTPRPTPKPTLKPTPRPTPRPTATPDTTAPQLTDLVITDPGPDFGDGEYHIFAPSGPCTHTATVRVIATDPDDPVSAVTLFYRPSGSGVLTTTMVRQDGSNAWVGVIAAQDAWSLGLIDYWVQAVDSHGNQSPQLGHSNTFKLNLGGVCIT